MACPLMTPVCPSPHQKRTLEVARLQARLCHRPPSPQPALSLGLLQDLAVAHSALVQGRRCQCWWPWQGTPLKDV